MNKLIKIEEVTEKGISPLILNNSLNLPIINFGMYGKTEQATTTGKNVLPNKPENWQMNKKTSWSGYADKPVNIIDSIESAIIFLDVKSSTKYSFLNKNKNAIWVNRIIEINLEEQGLLNHALYNNESNNKETYTFTTNAETTDIILQITKVDKTLLTTEDIEKLQVMFYEGENLQYEPYTGGKPCPSTEYPQEIFNSGRLNEDTGKYEVDVKVNGTNLIDEDHFFDMSNWKANVYHINLKPDTKYTFSRKDNSGTGSGLFLSVKDTVEGAASQIVNSSSANSCKQRVTFTTNDSGKIYFSLQNNNKLNLKDFLGFAQLEVGIVATPHELYKEQTLTLTSDRQLTKWDKLVEKDGEIGWLYKHGEKTLDGKAEETWRIHSNGQAFYTEITNAKFQNSFCNKYIHKLSAWAYPDYGIYSDNRNIQKYFRPPYEGFEMNVDNWKTFLNKNPLTVVYETETTEFVPLPQAEQEAIRALSTYYPTTVVSNNQNLYMEITYKKGITMSNYDSTQLIVQMKAFARTEALPVDSTEIWESLAEAQAYTKEANAYGGQTIKAKLEDGKFHTYTIQPSEAGFTLEEIGATTDTKQYVIIVDELPQSQQEQGILYINQKDNTGYIWNGKGWQIVFKEISAEVDKLKDKVTTLEADVKTKAPINNPVFTGKIMVGENEVALKSYVDGLISNLSNGAPGVVDKTHPLPVNGYKAGQTWRVAEAGTYAGNKCEAGDLIICIKTYAQEGAGNADFMAVQANIDGAVTSTATASTVGEIVVFDGSTGKIIKSSGVNIASLNDAIAKSHEHANKAKLDTYNKSQTELLATAKTEAQALVDGLKTVVDGKADKATTLAGYGIEDAYNKTEIDGKLKTISDNVNTKVDAATVDGKIDAAKQEITTEYTKVLKTRIGEIPDSETVKAYVDRVAGSGSADVSEQIETAKREAIAESKAYTDSCLTIVEF